MNLNKLEYIHKYLCYYCCTLKLKSFGSQIVAFQIEGHILTQLDLLNHPILRINKSCIPFHCLNPAVEFSEVKHSKQLPHILGGALSLPQILF